MGQWLDKHTMFVTKTSKEREMFVRSQSLLPCWEQLGYHLKGLKKLDLCLCGKGDGGKGRLCDSLLCCFSSLQFAFTHKSCVKLEETYNGGQIRLVADLLK